MAFFCRFACRACLKTIEGFIGTAKELTIMLTELRAVYDEFLRQSGSGKLKVASRDKTLTGCLTEVS